MTVLSNSPRLIKGALIGIDISNSLENAVVFQYNPDTMTRRLEARAAGGEGERGEVMRLSGPPKETITLTIEVDAAAADQLEKAKQLREANPLAVEAGIHPTLAALETMLYPKSTVVIDNSKLARMGTIEILPMEAPFILFVWGRQRVLPVRLTSFSITEEAYDPLLNPIQAKVELSLTVLSYQDFGVLHRGHALFLTHQMAKEDLATANVAISFQNILTGLRL